MSFPLDVEEVRRRLDHVCAMVDPADQQLAAALAYSLDTPRLLEHIDVLHAAIRRAVSDPDITHGIAYVAAILTETVTR